MITVTIKEAATKVLAAHAAGTLSAQMPYPKGSYFERTEDGCIYKCAIGQLFSDEAAFALQNAGHGYKFANGLIDDGTIVTDDPAALAELQLKHDNWSANRLNPFSGIKEEVFLEYVRSLAQ
jgi:hypothetical protein